MVRLIKSLFVVLGIFAMNFLNAQVTLNDLMDSNEKVDASKSNKKWILELNETNNAEIEKQIVSTEILKMTKSRHWISLSSDGEFTQEQSFQTSKKMYVDRLIGNLKEAGFTLSQTKVNGDERIYVYSRNNISVEVLALSTESTATTVYLVTLF